MKSQARKANRKRSKPNNTTPPDASASSQSFWTIGRVILLASGWLFSAFLVILELPAKIVSFAENKAAAQEHAGEWLWEYDLYEGRWTSDQSAWIGSNLISSDESIEDVGDVQLSIVSEGNGLFSGEIVTKELEENFAPWSRINIDGEVGLGGFHGEAWDIVQGSRQPVAAFRLKPEGEGHDTLRLIPDPSGAKIFPGEVLLWRTDTEMAGGRPGKRFEQVLRDVIRKQKNNSALGPPN